MKTSIVSMLVLAGMIVGANSALASRARVNVMGQGDNGFIFNGSGSLYYDDMYNIFYNPSYVNDFKNWVIIEKGPGGAGSTNSAEGGFVTSMMGMNLGVFMNREDAFTLTRLSGAADGSLYGTRPIDVIIGGDHGVKWGLGLTYGSGNSSNALIEKSRQLSTRLGVQVADFAPWVDYRLIGRTKVISAAGGAETKNKDLTVGVKYTYGDWTPYAAVRMESQKVADSYVAGSAIASRRTYLLGVGRNAKLGENARLVYNVNIGQNVDRNQGAGNSDQKRLVVPADLALEADVASWITVRGGLQYRLIDKTTGTGGNGTQIDSTTARIGATFHVNKVDLDWALGQGTAAGNLDTQTAGFDGGTFTNLSLAYRW